MAVARTLSRRALVGLGGAGLFAVACGSRKAKDTSQAQSFSQANVKETTEQPVAGGIATIPGADPQNYDYQVSFSVLQTLYTNRLLRYKTGSAVGPNQYEIIPDLAASTESPDPRRLVVKLHPAAFHARPPVNGRTVTSEDVKATFELLNANKPNYVYRYLVDFIETIETPAPDTVAFTLAYPTTLIYNAIAYYNSAIAPKEVIARDGNLEKLDTGTGPFTLERYEKGAGFSFRKNPAYFRTGTPYLDGIEMPISTDASARFDAFRVGRFDALDLALDLLPNARRTLGADATLQTQPGVGWSALMFNVQQQPWNDLRVRQAIHYALDRTAINQLTTDGAGTIRTGPVARGWPAWSRTDEQIAPEAARDLTKAKQLLTAAGYPNGFETEWLYGSGGASTDLNLKIGQVVQEQLKAVNIQMKIASLENVAWNRRLQTHDFGFSYWTIRAYPDPDDYLYPFLYPKGAKNFGQVDDPALTDLILKERQAPDAETRKKALQEIDSRWVNEFAYYLWTVEAPFIHVYNTRLHNYSARNPIDHAVWAETFVKK